MPVKLTQEQFENKVKQVDPSFTVIEKYNGYYFTDGKPRKILLQHECGYQGEYFISTFMQHKCKCRKCNKLIPIDHERYVEKINTINPDIEIIGEFKGLREKIRCKCKICNYIWSTDAQVLYKHGCPMCAGLIKTPEMFMQEIEEKFPHRYYFVTPYKSAHEDITVINRECNHEFTTKASYLLNGECKCPYCNGKKILVGFNDLWTTKPEIAKLLVNKDDGYKVTYQSGKRLLWECPMCHMQYKKTVSDVVSNNLRCIICSDKFPIGEKIIYTLLEYINVDFDYQKKV